MVAAESDWFAGSIAETYHKYLGPILFEFSASDIAESTARELPGKAKVLEVACGTGISTSHLALHLDASSKIDATDFNEDMLALANKYFPDLPNVRFSQADAHSLPFADESMDAVICQFGLMFFPDKPKALSEFHRVLKPGGLLALNVWADKSRFPFALIVDRVVASFFSSNPPNMTDVPYSLGTAKTVTDLLKTGHFRQLRTRALTQLQRTAASSALRTLNIQSWNVLCGWLRICKTFVVTKFLGQIRSCVRPVDAEFVCWP